MDPGPKNEDTTRILVFGLLICQLIESPADWLWWLVCSRPDWKISPPDPLSDAPPIDGVLQFTTGPNESVAEKIQAKVPGAYVVKAFNSVGASRMINPQYKQGIPTMFICGNNAEAKTKVSEIIEQFGWEPFDCGTIIAARAIEPLCMLWCIPGFQRNQWTHAFKLLTE
jgi:hypothetical protein